MVDIVNPDALLEAAQRYWPFILAAFATLRWLLSQFEKTFQHHLDERDHRMEVRIDARHHETQDKLNTVVEQVTRINGNVGRNTASLNEHGERIANLEGLSGRRTPRRGEQ